MDWMVFAQNDWSVYHDTTRIGVYVQKGKITPEQYQQITGQAYVATT
jgi:uncharacterized XkdX family phage protein